MAKFYGSLNLDKIKEAINGGITPFAGKKGKYLTVDIDVYDEVDQFGNQVSVSVYNKESKEKTYLGNFKKSQYQYDDSKQAPQASNQAGEDLPF